MAGEGMVVEGADNLVRTLHELADDLADLTPANEKAGQRLLEAANPPRDTGALDASGRVEVDAASGTVIYDEVYAGVIHNGWPAHNITAQPWLTDAVIEHTPDLVDVYADHVRDLVHQVHGT